MNKIKIKIKDEFGKPIIRFKGELKEFDPIWKRLKKKLK